MVLFLSISSLMQHWPHYLSFLAVRDSAKSSQRRALRPFEAWAWSSGLHSPTAIRQPASAITTLLWQNECPWWCPFQGAQGLSDQHRASPWARTQCPSLQGASAGFYGKCISLSVYVSPSPWVCGPDAEPHGTLFLDFKGQLGLLWYISGSLEII